MSLNQVVYQRCRRLCRRLLVGSLLGGGVMFGFLSDCNDRLVAITNVVDPCGTILANCAPGDFQVRGAGIGDFCIDPTCTIPGGCPTGNGTFIQPIGTRTDICP